MSSSIKRKRRQGPEAKPRVLLLPPLLTLLIVALVPLGYAVYIALHQINIAAPHLERPFVGLFNFYRVFTTTRSLNAFSNTFRLVVFAVSIQLGLGLMLAVSINSSFSKRAQSWLAVMFILPMAIPRVVASLVWNILYQPLIGPFNYVLGVLGIGAVEWLQNPRIALYSVALVDIWQWTPFVLLILLAGLEAQPLAVREAASMEGATGSQIFLYISLPLLKPFIIVAVLFRILESLRTFDYIYILTGGGPGISTETVDLYAYQVGIAEQGLISIGTAASISLLIITIVLSTIWIRKLHWGEEL